MATWWQTTVWPARELSFLGKLGEVTWELEHKRRHGLPSRLYGRILSHGLGTGDWKSQECLCGRLEHEVKVEKEKETVHWSFINFNCPHQKPQSMKIFTGNKKCVSCLSRTWPGHMHQLCQPSTESKTLKFAKQNCQKKIMVWITAYFTESCLQLRT